MKSDLSFQLESAAWPAFVVESGGTVRHANQAAIAFFGPRMEGEGLSLSALWAEQTESAHAFLARWERSANFVVPLRYHAKGGAVTGFATHICVMRGPQKRFLFQLFRHSEGATQFQLNPNSASASPSAAAAAAAAGSPAAPAANDLSRLGIPDAKPGATGTGETVFFQKQRLDCAVQLTRSVTLDFNNALTTILGHASLVLAQMELTHPFRASLIEVEKAAERAAEVAQNLAAFSRQEKEPPQHAHGNLNSVLRRVVEGFQKTAPPGIQWQIQPADSLFSVKFDEAKLQQAIVKVVENAVEAVGEPGRIIVSTRNLEITEPTQDRSVRLAPGTHVCIEVTDDGQGIPPDALPRIFEPFFTSKWGHRGLGLAWVYGIVTNHRGGVAVSSVPRQGTSVRIYLPATQDIVVEPLPLPVGHQLRQTVLLVDDEDLLLTMGKTVLSAFGYDVLTANSGLKAVDLIEKAERPIDLVITDLVMPQMSGRELIDQILLRLPGVPILRTSGYVRAGVDEDPLTYLQKPFTSHALLERVRNLLQDAAQSPEQEAAG